MKLTWFGGMAFRIHIGGQIILLNPADAPLDVNRAELASGADQVVQSGRPTPIDISGWKPRKAGRLLDRSDRQEPECLDLGDGTVVIDAPGEPPVVITPVVPAVTGRWTSDAVIVVVGNDALDHTALAILERSAPRWIALAGSETSVDAAFDGLRDRLDGTGLVALERGMALEI